MTGAVKAIAFDFGGTLFSTGKMGAFNAQMHESFISSLMAGGTFSHEHCESVYSSYTEAWRTRRARAESLPEREISSLDLLQSALTVHAINLDPSVAVEVLNSFHRVESELFLPLTHVCETLPRLHEIGYRLCIVSNNPWSESILASLRRFNIDHLFEEIVVSCDVGYRKPHRQIFSELLRRLDLKPSEILFVGDSYPHDIETPKSMGMKTCLVDFEGSNKNSQFEDSAKADLYLTDFSKLLLAVSSMLEAEAIKFLELWGCESDGKPFNTHSSLLWPVKRKKGPLMLKVVNPNDDEAHAAGVLKFFGGNGSVMLVEEAGHVQLLERIQSQNKSLEQMVLTGEDDLATQIICDVIARIHTFTSQKENLPKLIPFNDRHKQMLQYIAEGRVKAIDLPLFEVANIVYEELVQETCSTYRVLHGDIHHFNILYSDSRGWLAIDPKGILGPRAYEYVNVLCNPYPHLNFVANESRMNRQASLIAELGGFEVKTLFRLAFLHGAQCAAWSLFEPDQDYWIACSRTAASLAGIRLKN